MTFSTQGEEFNFLWTIFPLIQACLGQERFMSMISTEEGQGKLNSNDLCIFSDEICDWGFHPYYVGDTSGQLCIKYLYDGKCDCLIEWIQKLDTSSEKEEISYTSKNQLLFNLMKYPSHQDKIIQSYAEKISDTIFKNIGRTFFSNKFIKKNLLEEKSDEDIIVMIKNQLLEPIANKSLEQWFDELNKYRDNKSHNSKFIDLWTKTINKFLKEYHYCIKCIEKYNNSDIVKNKNKLFKYKKILEFKEWFFMFCGFNKIHIFTEINIMDVLNMKYKEDDKSEEINQVELDKLAIETLKCSYSGSDSDSDDEF